MIYEISFANEKFKSAQNFNAKMAKKFGVNKVIKYSPKDIDAEFIKDNYEIWNNKIGCGYWIWKPYIVKKTLELMKYGDYLLYMDSGSCIIDDINVLIKIMIRDKTDFMFFSLHSLEKYYSKRDAFMIMDCDAYGYENSPQRCATYFILRKSEKSVTFVDEWLFYSKDKRIISNNDNVMGYENYEGFIAHRNDQTILSLLSKKWNICSYRDPGNYGLDMKYEKEILNRSTYLQMFDDHRYNIMPKMYFTYKYVPRKIFEKWKDILFFI